MLRILNYKLACSKKKDHTEGKVIKDDLFFILNCFYVVEQVRESEIEGRRERNVVYIPKCR
jgi:hypothetical protein